MFSNSNLFIGIITFLVILGAAFCICLYRSFKRPETRLRTLREERNSRHPFQFTSNHVQQVDQFPIRITSTVDRHMQEVPKYEPPPNYDEAMKITKF